MNWMSSYQSSKLSVMDGTEGQQIFLFRKGLEGSLGAGCKIIEIFSLKKLVSESLCSDNLIARDSGNIHHLSQLREREVAGLPLKGFRGDPA